MNETDAARAIYYARDGAREFITDVCQVEVLREVYAARAMAGARLMSCVTSRGYKT